MIEGGILTGVESRNFACPENLDLSQAPSPPSRNQQGFDRLDSWKEIAAYLDREVRTVQRWEKTEGLPVRRHQHEKLGSVFAYKADLDRWWQQRQRMLADAEDASGVDQASETANASEPVEAAAQPQSEALPAPAAVHASTSLSDSVLAKYLVRAVLALVGIAAASYVYAHFFPPKRSGSAKLIVRPFRNLSRDPAQDIFCQGLTEAMETQLGQLDPDHLGVIANTTASIVKDEPIDAIRRQLNVDYVLEGSVFRDGNRLRIDAQLIRASDQTHRWDETYNRDANDVVALQNEVAQDVATEIRLTLSAGVQKRFSDNSKVDPDAYDSYLRGLVSWSARTPEGLAKSSDYFEQAIRKSPNFALAYAGLSDSYSILSAVPTAAIPPLQAMPKAKLAAETAIRLDPGSAEAQAALALVRQSYDYDLDGAERAYQRAFAINPSYGTARHWHSVLLMARGRHQEALAEIEKARSLDPLSPVIPASRIQAFYFARQYDRAIEEARKAIEVEPNFLQIHYHLAQSLLQKGLYADAIAELQKMQQNCSGIDFCTMALGHAYAVAGNRGAALKSLADLKSQAGKGKYVPAIYFTAIYAGLGETGKALDWLQKAYDERTEYLIFLNVEPMADPLRSDPRFRDLLRRVGLG